MFTLPASPTRREVGAKRPRAPGGRPAGCGVATAGVLSAVCAVGGILLTMQTVGTTLSTSGLDKIALSALSSVLFILVSNALSRFTPTRHVGRVLVDRMINTVENWEEETLRSSVELAIWLWVCWSTAEITGNWPLALGCALCSSWVVVLAGELMTSRLRTVERKLRRAWGEDEEAATSLASGSSVVLCMYGYGVLTAIYAHVDDIALAGLLAGLAGSGLLVAAKLFEACPPTQRAGKLLERRITRTFENWRSHPFRSATESCAFVGLTLSTYTATSDPLIAIQISTFGGCLVCMTGELASYASNSEHEGQRSWCMLAAEVATIAWTWSAWSLSGGSLRVSLAALLLAFGAVLVLCSRLQLLRPLPSWPTAGFDRAHATPLDVSGPQIAARHSRRITREELALHASESDLWLAVHGGVYDVSAWHHTHPGGKVIMEYAGQDATDQFEFFHNPTIAPHLRRFLIGHLADSPAAALVAAPTCPDGAAGAAVAELARLAAEGAAAEHMAPADIAAAAAAASEAATLEYRELRGQLWAEGAFAPSGLYSLIKQLVTLGFVGVAVALLACAPAEGSAWLRFGLAPCLLGIGLQQAAFLAHDAMHNGVFARRGVRTARDLLGQLNAGVLLGISVRMWLEEHNEHHAYTLRPHADPQFKYFPLWLQSTKEIAHWKAELPRADVAPRARALAWRAVKALQRAQHLTFLPIVMVIGRVNFIGISWAHALGKRHGLDALSMGLHLGWYALLLGTFFSTARERLLFTLVHYTAVGTLHVQLLLSHLSTTQLTPEEDRAHGVFRAQLASTRNITSSWYSHWFHGGLEMQIEHHLFPQLPRHRLHAVAPRVRALAEKHGVAYVETGFLEALVHCLRDLRRLSTALATVDFI